MSASTQTAPRQLSFGRFPAALAMLALVVLAVAVALVALNGTKAAAPATSGAKGAPPPAVIDHGWSSAVEYGQSVSNVPFYDHGWSKVNEPGQSVTNVPFYDHGWSSAETYSTPQTYNGPFYYNGAGAYPPFVTTYETPGALGYPPFGMTYSGSRIDAVDHGARDEAGNGAGTIDSPYVAPRPRNQ
jgi:hypothetical protein